MKAFVASVVTLAASTGASPAADPQLYTTGLLGAAVVPNVAVGVVPEVALKDSGLVHHPNGAITPENTAAQKESGLNQGTPIQQYQLTGKAVTTTYGLHGVPLALGKREAEAEADPALVYAGVPAVVSTSGLVAHPNGAVTPDYTPAQKIAAANHLAAKGIAPIIPSLTSSLASRPFLWSFDSFFSGLVGTFWWHLASLRFYVRCFFDEHSQHFQSPLSSQQEIS